MSRRYISEFEPGMRVDEPFALTSKEMRSARTGEAYLALELSDRTGRVPAIMFRPPREAADVPVGVVAHVRGTVTEYRGARRVSVTSLRAAEQYDLRDIAPSGVRDVREMLAELRHHIRSVEESELRAILRGVFSDAGFMARFRTSPATVRGHHAYIGGLLEHTIAVTALCARVAGSYPQVDRDLLVTGALLHDVGVADALTVGAGITPTDEGLLLGHEVLGDRRIGRACSGTAEGRGSTQLRLSHMVLSHHASDGTPGLAPSTVEAVVLQHADRADADTASFLEVGKRAVLAGEDWTDAANPFGRPLSVQAPAEDTGAPPLSSARSA